MLPYGIASLFVVKVWVTIVLSLLPPIGKGGIESLLSNPKQVAFRLRVNAQVSSTFTYSLVMFVIISICLCLTLIRCRLPTWSACWPALFIASLRLVLITLICARTFLLLVFRLDSFHQILIVSVHWVFPRCVPCLLIEVVWVTFAVKSFTPPIGQRRKESLLGYPQQLCLNLGVDAQIQGTLFYSSHALFDFCLSKASSFFVRCEALFSRRHPSFLCLRYLWRVRAQFFERFCIPLSCTLLPSRSPTIVTVTSSASVHHPFML
mmetsp:Transcript_42762/g.110244  ORF Transcript_42762/g.110244 Transcript_42762/m.110244 type:complete len:264 (-) Transcript_42762:191-982(-)